MSYNNELDETTIYNKYKLAVVQKWNSKEHGENTYLENKLISGFMVHYTMDESYDSFEDFLNDYLDFKNLWIENFNQSINISHEYEPKIALITEFELDLYCLGFDRGNIITKFKNLWKKHKEKMMFYKHPSSILYREINGRFPKYPKIKI